MACCCFHWLTNRVEPILDKENSEEINGNMTLEKKTRQERLPKLCSNELVVNEKSVTVGSHESTNSESSAKVKRHVFRRRWRAMSMRRKGPSCAGEPLNRSLDAISSNLAVRSSCGQAVNECTCPFANSTTTGPFANTSYVERNGRRYKVILEPVLETTKNAAPFRRHTVDAPEKAFPLDGFDLPELIPETTRRLYSEYPQLNDFLVPAQDKDFSTTMSWIVEIRDRLVELEQISNSTQYHIPKDVLHATLKTASEAFSKLLKKDYQRLQLSPKEEKMKVLPEQILTWLKSTFGQEKTDTGTDKKRTFRGVVAAMRIIYGFKGKKLSLHQSGKIFALNSDSVAEVMATVNLYHFNVFDLTAAGNGKGMRYLLGELLAAYGLIDKFDIQFDTLVRFADQLEFGYNLHSNPYHNSLHACDVLQTTHYHIHASGISNWLSDIEIFAMLFAAAVHDFEHTGTTNNFHVQTKSRLAMIYNDRSVLENHHLSVAFRLLQNPDIDILMGLSKDEFKDFRSLVIDMVLATDMSLHFQQVKTMKKSLSNMKSMDKGAVMSFIVHSADISHPTKTWELHERWTAGLVEEFFRQGDAEKERGLPCSPLCDRETTQVSQSQIGFIDFIIIPTYSLLSSIFESVNEMLLREAESLLQRFREEDSTSHNSEETILAQRVKKIGLQGLRVEKFREMIERQISSNHETWSRRAQEDKQLQT